MGGGEGGEQVVLPLQKMVVEKVLAMLNWGSDNLEVELIGTQNGTIGQAGVSQNIKNLTSQ